MKKIAVLLLAAALCLSLAACGKEPEPQQSPQEIQTEEPETEETPETPQQSDRSSQGEDTAETSKEPVPQSFEWVGPWQLDLEKNDLAALSNRFPEYEAQGAGMEIRSNGQMSWNIGEEGWYGTYTVDGDTLHAQLQSALEERALSWDFPVTTENESVMLEMTYEDLTLYWVYEE